MKRFVRIFLPVALLIVLIMPGAALAAGDTTEVEQKWIDFQRAVMDRMVKEGTLTAQEAGDRIKEFETRFAQSEGDSIFEFFADKNRPGSGTDGKCRDGKCKVQVNRDDAAFRIYSMITGKSVDELKKACESGGVTIWKLAEKEGRLDMLKDKLITGHTAGLDEMVKSGVLSEQQRQKIIGRLEADLNQK